MNILALPVLGTTMWATTETDVGDKVDAAVEATFDAVKMVATIVGGMIVGLLAGLILVAILRMFVRRSEHLDPIYSAINRRLELLSAIIGAWMGFQYRLGVMPAEPPGWLDWVEHGFVIVIIVAVTWVLSGLVDGTTRAINERVEESSEARAARITTQTQILRRVVKAAVWILGMAGVLLTFPGARAAGASILASAGIISVVAGLAAQTTLGNVFAGLQLAFTDSIRVGDIVLYEDNYTTVEEITLTYVVLAVWDGRRIIVPSTIMTTRSFENWTRRAPEMTGDVEITVDWAVPIDAARLRFEQILRDTDLWDGRTGVLQVADASEIDRINLRALVSAKDSPTLTDLRNQVREEMVRWIQDEAPQAIPHGRLYTDEKGDIRARNEETMARVREREKEQPPVFEPSGEGGVVPNTKETEIISPKDVAEIVRVSVAEREGRLSGTAPAANTHPANTPVEAKTTVMPISEPQTGSKSAIFSGSPEAEQRAKAFSGPGDKVYEERQRKLDSDTETPVKVDQEAADVED